MKSSYFLGAVAASGLVALGCAVGPNHKAPEVKGGETYRGDEKSAQANQKRAKGEKTPPTFADLPWWAVYRDPTLFSLVREATSKAYDLRIAFARVEVARQAHRAAIWSLWPTIGVNGGAGSAVGASSIPTFYPPAQLDGQFGIGASASWEPDVWGRLRRLTQVQLHRFEAEDEDRRGVYVALVGDVAESYFSLMSLDLQRSFAEQAVQTRRETLTVFEQRSSGGVGNDLEVSRAKASLRQAEASVLRVGLAATVTENTLAFLLARPPGPIARGTALDQLELPPDVPPGLPSTLLERRPDIRAAEKRLLAANATIGVEMADFFPRFELTGFLGVVSPDLSVADAVRGGVGLFHWTLPFLGGEKERADYDAAKATWEGATAFYERTAVNAFREVANALVTIQMLREQRVAVDGQVQALSDAQAHAMDRYRGGVANYLDVLTAQEQLLLAQLEVADLMGRQHTAVSRLYRALGGGWPLPDDDDKKDDAGDTKESVATKATGNQATASP